MGLEIFISFVKCNGSLHVCWLFMSLFPRLMLKWPNAVSPNNFIFGKPTWSRQEMWNLPSPSSKLVILRPLFLGRGMVFPAVCFWHFLQPSVNREPGFLFNSNSGWASDTLHQAAPGPVLSARHLRATWGICK